MKREGTPLGILREYEFGSYRIGSDERLLHRGSSLVPLPPKVADTLLVLLQNAGRMVEKGDLMKAVWPDTFVEEGALTRNISLLRKTLGENGDEAVFIETIPKRGYRFIAAVRPVEEVAEAPERPGAAPAKPQPGWMLWAAMLLLAALFVVSRYGIRGVVASRHPGPVVQSTILAVMPFRSLETDASQNYFAEGMTQALITGLAKLPRLQVISLAAGPNGPKDANVWTGLLGNQSVSRVLTGTILRSGRRVRIDAQLLDPHTRSVYWANSYERDAEDIFTLESELAKAIAGEIQLNLTDQDRERLRPSSPVNPKALDAYLRGRYFWNRRTEDGLRRAAQYFQQAIAADPTYSLAYAGLADSYSLLGSLGSDGIPPNEAMPKAKSAAQKAIDLDPNLAEGHVSLAYIEMSYDWDLPGANREFSRALAINPNSAAAHHWYSHYFMASGDLPRATAQMHEAVQLEPLSPIINIGIGWCMYYSRQFDQAIQQYRSVAEMEPTYALAHQTLGMAYQQKGLFDQAIEEFKRSAAFSGDSPSSVAALASAYAASGKTAEARQELARLEEMSHRRYVPAFYFASVHQSMGELSKTFEWGWKAIGERCDYLMYLRVEPRVGRLAGNPEFLRAMAALHR